MKHKRAVEVGAVAVTILIVATIYAALFYSSLQKQVISTLEEISNQSVQVVKKEVASEEDSLGNLAEYLGENESLDVDTMMPGLRKVKEYNDFEWMGFLLEDGTAYTTDGRRYDAQSKEYYQLGVQGKKVSSDVLKNLLSAEKCGVYSVPVTFKDGETVVLFATYDIIEFGQSLSTYTFGGAGYTCVVQEDGEYIARPSNQEKKGDSQNIFEVLEQMSPINHKSVVQMKTAMDAKKNGNIVFQETGQRDLRGHSYYLYYQSIGMNNWYLVSVIPVSVMQKEMNKLLILAYLFGIICISSVIILMLHAVELHKKSQRSLEKLVYVDKITGYDSFARFKQRAKDVLSSAESGNYAVILTNIEKFQYINDLYGYKEGDRALRYFGDMLHEVLESRGIFARMQGDHFVILLEYKLRNQILDVLHNLQRVIDKNKDSKKRKYDIKVTAGIYEVEDYQKEIDAMVDLANLALNKNKEEVLKKFTFYDNTLRDEKIKNKRMEDCFEDALKNGEFIIYYQPKYSIEDKCFSGAEALVRWKSPSEGLISPVDFIPVFENNGTIVELDEYVFEVVCRDIGEWIKKGYDVMPVSVNVSRLHLYQNDFVRHYQEIIECYQVPVEMLQLELTETIVFDNEGILINIIHQFKAMGIKLLMDDFGSGYSSVNMLRSIPIDVLKLDKCMIDDCQEPGKGQQIISMVVELAKEMGISVTAEGVETKEQYDFLESVGCDYIQGYYCAKPMGKPEYEEILKGNGLLQKQ